MQDDEIVEVMARGLFEHDCPGAKWADQPSATKDRGRLVARQHLIELRAAGFEFAITGPTGDTHGK